MKRFIFLTFILAAFCAHGQGTPEVYYQTYNTYDTAKILPKVGRTFFNHTTGKLRIFGPGLTKSTIWPAISPSGFWKTAGTSTLTADATIASTFKIGFGVTPTAKFHIKGIGTTTGESFRIDDSGGTNKVLILDDGTAKFLGSTNYIQMGNTTNPTLTFSKSGIGDMTEVYNGNTTYTPPTGGYGFQWHLSGGLGELVRYGGGGATGVVVNTPKTSDVYLQTYTGSTSGTLSATDNYGHFSLANVGARFSSAGSNRIAAGIWFEHASSAGLYIHNASTNGSFITNHDNHYISLGYGVTGGGATMTGNATHSMIRIIKKVDNLGGFDHTGAYVEMIRESALTGDFLKAHNGSGTTYFKVDYLGKISSDATETTGGTTGNQTINKPTGSVNIAAAGTTVTVTNSLCTTSSHVFAMIETNDATAYVKNVVKGSGTFTINLGAAATAEVRVSFWVIN